MEQSKSDRTVIATTKLTVPRRPASTVERPGLLPDAPADGLTIVVAAAGSGKTTLLSGWADRLALPVAWVSLDPTERDPAVFWACVLASVGRALGPNSRLPGGAEGDIVGTLIPKLINYFDQAGTPLLIVLDDFHVLEGSDVVRQLETLVERAPAELRVALGTREEPALPLDRWRAQQKLHEVRSSELRFDVATASRLLNEQLGLSLGEAAVGHIVDRTEGWATGVYLLGRAALEGPVAGAPVSGDADQRHLFSYLASEVLDGLDAETASFLMATAVPDKVAPDLAAELTARADAAAMLRQISRQIAFVTASGVWYRYHQLFRETLLERLRRDDPEQFEQLHRAASRWFEKRGYLSEAIDHLLAAGAEDEAAEAVARHWVKVANAGNMATVDRWLKSLPAERIATDPELVLINAWVALNLRHYDEVDRLLAGPVLRTQSLPRDGLPSDLAAAAIRSHLARHRGDVGTSLRWGLTALEVPTRERTVARATASVVAGVAHYWSGQHDEAERALQEAVNAGLASGEVISVVHASVHLAASRGERGDHVAAARAVAEAEALIGQHGLDAYSLPGPAYLARGLAAAADGDIDGALDDFDAAHRLGIRAFEPLEQARALLAMAATAVDAKRRGDAQRSLQDAAVVLEVSPDVGFLKALQVDVVGSLAPLPSVDEHAAARLIEPLTPRELSVLRLLTSNLTLAEIGRELYVSVNTVKSHTKAIYRKLGASSRRAAVSAARRLGVL